MRRRGLALAVMAATAAALCWWGGAFAPTLSDPSSAAVFHWPEDVVGEFRCFRAGGPVRAVALSPDRRRLASGGDDRVLHVWDVAGGTSHSIAAHTAHPISCVAFHPDNRSVLAGTTDGSLRLYDISGGEPLLDLTFAGGSAVVEAVFSPDGEALLSRAADGTVYYWDLSEPKLVAHCQVRVPMTLATTLSFGPQPSAVNTRAGTGNSAEQLVLWDVVANRETSLLGPRDGVVAFAPAGRRLFHVSGGRLTRWNPPPERPLTIAEGLGEPGFIWTSPDGGAVAIGREMKDNRYGIEVWDLESRRRRGQFAGHEAPILCGLCSPDGRAVVSADRAGTSRVWLIGRRTE